MNNAPNSDSKQCPESKLRLMHRVHTQRTLAAHTLCQAARTAPCRKPPPGHIVAFLSAVSQRTPAVSRYVPRARTRCYAPCRSLLGRVTRSPAVLWCMPGHVAALYCDTLNNQASPTRCRTLRAQADRIAVQPAVSWPLDGRVAGPCCTPRPAVSRYNLLYHDPDWKMGSSPSSLLHFFFSFVFFSLICFFILFHLLEDHKKKKNFIFQ